MLLQEIALQSYRNLDLKLAPSPSLNLALAPNGSGKTNLLEAINLLSTGKSFRSTPDEQLLQVNSTGGAFIRGEVEKISGTRHTLVTSWDHTGKKSYIKDGKRTNLAGFRSVFGCLIHAPTTMDLVTGGGQLRRNFLDTGLRWLKPNYSKVLTNYNRVLASKRSLLKVQDLPNNLKQLEQQLAFWNEKLAHLSAVISFARLELLASIAPGFSSITSELYSQEQPVSAEVESRYLDPDLVENTLAGKVTRAEFEKLAGGELLKILTQNSWKEAGARRPLYGAHRDDYVFLLGGLQAKFTASRGQQRLLSLGLHFALLELLDAQREEKLILLLDDVLSELDVRHKFNTLNYLERLGRDHQIFLSSASEADFSEDQLAEYQLLSLGTSFSTGN